MNGVVALLWTQGFWFTWPCRRPHHRGRIHCCSRGHFQHQERGCHPCGPPKDHHCPGTREASPVLGPRACSVTDLCFMLVVFNLLAESGWSFQRGRAPAPTHQWPVWSAGFVSTSSALPTPVCTLQWSHFPTLPPCFALVSVLKLVWSLLFQSTCFEPCA